MKKRLVAGICMAVLILSIGSMQAFAAPRSASFNGAPPAMGQKFGEIPEGMPKWTPGEKPEGMPERVPGERPEGMPDAPRKFRGELTEAEKAKMEAERIEREGKIEAFIAALSSEQKALYDAMMPVKPQLPDKDSVQGQKPSMPDRTAIETMMAEMKAKQEAFIASLTVEQKEAFDELFNWQGDGHHFKVPNGEHPFRVPNGERKTK